MNLGRVLKMEKEQLILNANIVTRDGVLENHAVILAADRIKQIVAMDRLDQAGPEYRRGPVHDAAGAYLAPGFIDIHSDSIESIAQPRPTSIIDFEIALMEHEKQLVNQGITTMYHSLSFLRKEGASMRDKETRKPVRMREMAELIRNLQHHRHLIRHRFHCRFDIRNREGLDILMDYLAGGYINLLSFNDHTPGQGQYRDLLRYRENLKNYKPGINEEEIECLVAERMAVPVIAAETLKKTAEIARGQGIPVASHDDDSEEKVEYNHVELQVAISEFPVELSVARKAKARGMHTVAGAPNVLLGRSHSGNMAAAAAILDGSIDILCSDYYPPAMLHAVFKLHYDYKLPLWDAFNLITLNPAQALGTDDEYGSVEPGKKADLLAIQVFEGRPFITKVFIDGDLVSELNYRQS
jgi:alpha-D-ribose 1-methylphosphonate 5-triphosphate diphosphatase